MFKHYFAHPSSRPSAHELNRSPADGLTICPSPTTCIPVPNNPSEPANPEPVRVCSKQSPVPHRPQWARAGVAQEGPGAVAREPGPATAVGIYCRTDGQAKAAVLDEAAWVAKVEL